MSVSCLTRSFAKWNRRLWPVLVLLVFARTATAGPLELRHGVVISTSTEYEWRDCEWKVPCPKTVAVIEAEGWRYSIRGAGWKGGHPDLFHVGDQVEFQGGDYSAMFVWVAGKKYLFKIMARDAISETPSPAQTTPLAPRQNASPSIPQVPRSDGQPATAQTVIDALYRARAAVELDAPANVLYERTEDVRIRRDKFAKSDQQHAQPKFENR